MLLFKSLFIFFSHVPFLIFNLSFFVFNLNSQKASWGIKKGAQLSEPLILRSVVSWLRWFSILLLDPLFYYLSFVLEPVPTPLLFPPELLLLELEEEEVALVPLPLVEEPEPSALL